MSVKNSWKKAQEVFRNHGSMLRTSDAIALGIHPRTLYAMRDSGVLERISRGLFRLADHAGLSNLDIVTVAARIPQGVICLLSALSFHEITTQNPFQVHVAVPRGTKQPRLEYPPIRIYRFSESTFSSGVEIHKVDTIKLNVYSIAKTVADCFKYRNKIGLDVALEALREGWREQQFTMDEMWYYAKICRVANVMRPYLESLV